MTLHLFELAGLMVLILLVSATLVLWMQSTKRRPNPMLKVLLLVVLIVFCLGSMKYAGEALGIIQSATIEERSNPFRLALLLLEEPYPSYTSANNLASAHREAILPRFEQMEKLELADLQGMVSGLHQMIRTAPATGQSGIYNMRMTSAIQARWEELRLALIKRVERSS